MPDPLSIPPTALSETGIDRKLDCDVEFLNGADSRIFQFTYEGEARPLWEYLLQRYRYGRGKLWAESFYPHRVRLNGNPVRAETLALPGDRISYLHLRGEEPPADAPGAPMFEDEWLLVLVKGDSAPVNPSGVYYFTSLAIQAREHFDDPQLTPLHRLDLETSGPVMFAKQPRDLKVFHRMFQGGRIHKRYRALVHGTFPPGLREIEGWIVPDEDSRIHTKLKLIEGGDVAEFAENGGNGGCEGSGGRNKDMKPLLSRTRVLEVIHHDLGATGGAKGKFSELILQPLTGKTNQLRVHLAHAGHPIVGDKKYHPDEGIFLDWVRNRDFNRLRDSLLLPRQALHCEGLRFDHPFTGAEVEIVTPNWWWRAKVAPLLGRIAV